MSMPVQSVPADPAAPRRAARPLRPRAPALPPLDALDRTHRQMMEMLGALSRLIDRLDDAGADEANRRAARLACQFFDTTARQHHADEEALIFPPLVRRADKALLQAVRRLQQDHGWLEEDWLAISPQLQAVAQGYSWYDVDELRHAVGVFTALYHEHIGLEESLAYPAARAQLQAEEAARCQRVDAGNAGPQP